MKVSMQNGRNGSAKHNDRNFDITKSKHIKEDAEYSNSYINCYEDDSLTFEECERKYYKEHFSDMFDCINQNYIKDGHIEKCKTIEQFMQIKRYTPTETILQIGNVEGSANEVDFSKCVQEYLKELQKFENFKVLDVAFHFDEATPHAHLRGVFFYEENGIEKIGQEKALEKMGIELPKPDKKVGQYNNRKITFDAHMREKWQDICEEYGFEIDRNVKSGSQKHKEKIDYIVQKELAKQPQIDTIIENERLRNERDKYKTLYKKACKMLTKQQVQELAKEQQKIELENVR